MLGLFAHLAPVPGTARNQQNCLALLRSLAIAHSPLIRISSAGGLWLSLAIAAIATPVAPDGSTNSTVLDAVTNLPSDCSQNCLIQGSDQAGGNLFHSFSDFNVPSGVTVTLDGQGLDRILMRVTGGSPSNIEGLLQVEGQTDLFFLNPAGLTIGSDGRLDINGSFIGSTAEALLFANGDAFTTRNSNTPLLSLSVPSGLQFGLNTTGSFQVSGDTNQPPLWQPGSTGKTFALVIDSSTPATFTDRSHAVTAGGLVLANIGFVGQQVNLLETSAGWDLDFSNISQAREIRLERAIISTQPDSPSGIVKLKGKVTLLDSEILLQSQDGIAAGEFQFQGESLTVQRSQVLTQTEAGGGNISLMASDTIQLLDDSLFSIESQGAETAGDIKIEALGPGGFQLTNSQLFSTVETAGGNIEINAPRQLALTEGEIITSTDLAGANVSLSTETTLQLNGQNFISLNSGNGTYAGTGGNLSIEALQVFSRGRDADIKVVGLEGNFSTNISSTPQFQGFSGSQKVIRDNQRSEIEILKLDPFPEAPRAPVVEPPVVEPPVVEPPTPPILIPVVPVPEVPIPEVPIPTTPVPEIPVSNGPIPEIFIPQPSIGEPIPHPIAQTPAPPPVAASPPAAKMPAMARPPTNVMTPILDQGNGNTFAVGRYGSTSAYRARRPGCAMNNASLTEFSVSGRGGLPNRPGSLMTSAQSLTDLGQLGLNTSNLSLEQDMPGDSIPGDWRYQPGNTQDKIVTEAATLPILQEIRSWQRTASGKVQLLVRAHPGKALGASQSCHSLPRVSTGR